MGIPQRVRAEVQTIKEYGTGVYELNLELDRRYTRFRPGQFLHLALDDFDPSSGYWPESRVFSLASEPRQDFVTIVFSVKGAFTRRMADELGPGSLVWLKLPYGDFVIDATPSTKGALILIAGGTGISPFIPFLASTDRPERPAHLFYGIKLPDHLLFKEQLVKHRGVGQLELHLFVEEGTVTLPYERGRLSIPRIGSILGDSLTSGQFYLSGPPGMIRSFQSELVATGVLVENIYIDAWE